MLEKNNETKKTTTKVANGKKSTDKPSIPLMYVGSSIKGVVSHGDIYKDGLPEKFQETVKKQKAVDSLIVPITQAGDALKAVKEKGSRLYCINEEVKKNFETKGE
ncbi:MAG: hypothetical protein PUG66_07910 [Clostridiales bacterium]|nr:hypothetical protein [Eubacterium sp.]MDD7349746.1 hypothetical protein [Clostridiales bacterium]